MSRPLKDIRSDIHDIVGDDYPLLWLLVELEKAVQENTLAAHPPATVPEPDYSRSRHTHPDTVGCREAGPQGHPPFPATVPDEGRHCEGCQGSIGNAVGTDVFDCRGI